MKKIILFSILFCLLIYLFSCNKESADRNSANDVSLKKDSALQAEEIKTTEIYGVVNGDRLRLRSDNDIHSKTLRYLDMGTIVSVLKKDDKRFKIGQMEDYWYNVEFDGIKGWVFGFYIDTYYTFDDAKSQAEKYLENNTSNDIDENYYDEKIDNNLFFLSDGKLLLVTDGKSGKASILDTQPGMKVVYYFFTNIPKRIYYIAKQPNTSNLNGNLYYYDINDGINKLVLNNVYAVNLSEKKNVLLALTFQKSFKNNYWLLKLFELESGEDPDPVAKIKQNRDFEKLDKDLFSKTLQRELGSLVKLNLDDKGNFIYFKPPEENLTYLISIVKGNFIQVETEQHENYEIDSSRYIKIYSREDIAGDGKYSIILKDKYSGMEKELLSSTLYPINFTISPKKNLIAITMIDVNKVVDGHYSSSVYVLSLLTNSLMPISTEGHSYQPQWRKTLMW